MMSLDCFQLLDYVISRDWIISSSSKHKKIVSKITQTEKYHDPYPTACLFLKETPELTLFKGNTCFDRGSSIKKMGDQFYIYYLYFINYINLEKVIKM